MLEAVLKRDRNIVIAALLLLTALAWAYLARLNAFTASIPALQNMPGMPNMPGMNMAPASHPFAPVELTLTLIMWAVMMIGMMTPSAAPMILLYARVGRQAPQQGTPFAATGWFAGGYLAAWCVFSVLAGVAQSALAQAALITPMMAADNNILSGALLIVAGVWQWVPWKDACLANCQTPLLFLQRAGGFKRDAKGAFVLGLRHGLYCVGCCWALMTLLFVGGVMNLLWVAVLAIFVLAEKLIPSARIFTRAAGLVAVAAGLISLGRTLI